VDITRDICLAMWTPGVFLFAWWDMGATGVILSFWWFSGVFRLAS